jgi:hypothetical protein
MNPAIGVPRIYAGDTIPVLYHGETATARIDSGVVFNALTRDSDVSVSEWMGVPVREWTVEPTPGWEGRWLRWRYRVWGRWFSREAPKIESRITTTSRGPE